MRRPRIDVSVLLLGRIAAGLDPFIAGVAQTSITRHRMPSRPGDAGILAAVPLLAMDQMIRFCATGAGRIAYATAGDGPALVFPAWWVSHLESNWEDASFRSFLLALADRHTVVRYDRIGTGLSERRRGQGATSLEAEVEVLGELLDHVDLSRCTLFGFSSGAASPRPTPPRTPRALAGSCPPTSMRTGRIADEEVRRSMVSIVRRHWGLGARVLAGVFMPEGDADDLRRFARLQRKGATREMAASLLELTYEMDATDAYCGVVAPALVLHRRDDRARTIESRALGVGQLAAPTPRPFELLRLARTDSRRASPERRRSGEMRRIAPWAVGGHAS